MIVVLIIFNYFFINVEIKHLLGSIGQFTIKELNPKEVDEHQQRMLGPFWKRGAIAPGLSASDLSMVFLELPQDAPEPTTEDGTPISAIIERNLQMQSGQDVITMVGRSGCGKTATMIRCARQHYLIYISCSNRVHQSGSEMVDTNYARMARDITQTYEQNFASQCTTRQEMIDRDANVKDMAQQRLRLDILCRLLFLRHLFLHNPHVTPEQFLRAQVNGGAILVGELVTMAKKYSVQTVELMLWEVSRQVRACLKPDQGLIIGLDEATLADHTLQNKLISPSALYNKVHTQIYKKNKILILYYRWNSWTVIYVYYHNTSEDS